MHRLTSIKLDADAPSSIPTNSQCLFLRSLVFKSIFLSFPVLYITRNCCGLHCFRSWPDTSSVLCVCVNLMHIFRLFYFMYIFFSVPQTVSVWNKIEDFSKKWNNNDASMERSTEHTINVRTMYLRVRWQQFRKTTTPKIDDDRNGEKNMWLNK